ncbi:MAG: O-antigen ligase family protein [Erysipelotrichaceae bacterium]
MDKNKMLEKAFKLCLMCSIVLVPFIVFIPNEVRYTYGITLSMYVVGIVLLILIVLNKFRLKLKLENKIGIFFLFTLLIATIVAVDPKIAFFGNEHRHEGLIIFGIYILLFIVSSNYFILNEKTVKIIIVSGVIMSIITVMQFFGNDFLLVNALGRDSCAPSGLLGNQNFNATYQMMFATLSSAMFVFYKNKSYLLAAAINFGGLICTLTRGCWLSFGLICLITLILLFKDKKRRYRIWTLTICFIFVFLSLNLLNGGVLKNRASTIKDNLNITNEETGSGRVEIWKICLGTIDDRFMIGTGPDTLQQRLTLYEKTVMDDYYLKHGASIDKAHCEPLEYLLCGGVFTMISYVIMCGTILFKLYKKKDNPIIFILFIISLGYFVQALFNISTVGVAQIYWIVLGQSVYVIYRDDKKMLIESE